MDVVYILRRGDKNEELRFSLRTLAHLPHDRVWAVGYRPPWALIDEIPTRQRLGKYENSLINIRAACTAAGVSDDFVFFNDDFFVLGPLDEVPVLHRGTVRRFVADHIRSYGRPGPYLTSLMATAELLTHRGIRDPICFEGHVPLVFNKSRMLAALELAAKMPMVHYRTLYGNLERWDGVEIDDWKIRDSTSVPEPDWLFTSTTDSLFMRGAAGRWLRERFSQPSPYERS
jgi:hypothetical protein